MDPTAYSRDNATGETIEAFSRNGSHEVGTTEIQGLKENTYKLVNKKQSETDYDLPPAPSSYFFLDDPDNRLQQLAWYQHVSFLVPHDVGPDAAVPISYAFTADFAKYTLLHGPFNAHLRIALLNHPRLPAFAMRNGRYKHVV